MFDNKAFIAKLYKFELDNPYDITSEEIHAIMEDSKLEDDPLYIAVVSGFLCGCMKAGV